MLSRIASILLAAVGLVAAFLVALWALVFLGMLGLAATVAHMMRGRRGAGPDPAGRVVQGEFEVVNEDVDGEQSRVSRKRD